MNKFLRLLINFLISTVSALLMMLVMAPVMAMAYIGYGFVAFYVWLGIGLFILFFSLFLGDSTGD